MFLIILGIIAIGLIVANEYQRHLIRQDKERAYEMLKHQTTSKYSTSKNTITNRKRFMIDDTSYNCDYRNVLRLGDQSQVNTQIRNILRDINSNQSSVSSDTLLQVFYSHRDFDKFTFIETDYYNVHKSEVERKLMLSNQSQIITFPFAIKLTKSNWEIIDSQSLSQFMQTQQFNSVDHTYLSELAWYFVFNQKDIKDNLMKFRTVDNHLTSTVDKFVSLYLLSSIYKYEFNIEIDVDFKQIINDLQDDDFYDSVHLFDMRQLLNHIANRLQEVIF